MSDELDESVALGTRRRIIPCWWSLAAGVLVGLPTLLTAYPPMGDLPYHEQIVGLLARLGDDTFTPQSVYALNIGHPNQLWYAIAVGLSLLVGATWACKLTIFASMVAIPLATASAARRFGRHTWFAALAAPVALGWFYYWGLVTNMLGASVLALALPVFDAHTRVRSIRSTTRAAIMLLLLYAAHESALVVGCIAYGVFAFPHLRAAPKTLAALALPAVMITTVGVIQLIVQRRFLWGVIGEQMTFPSPWHRLTLIPGLLFSGHPNEVLAMLSTILAALLFVGVIVDRKRPQQSVRGLGWRERLSKHRLDVTVALTLVVFFAAPATYHQHTLLYHRFLPLAWLLFVIARAPRLDGAVRPLVQASAFAVPLGVFFMNWPQFVESQRLYSQLDTLIPQIEIGQSVYLLETASRGSRLFPVSSAVGHVLALRGGRTVVDFTDLATIPLRRRPTCRWEGTAMRLQRTTVALDHFYADADFLRFRYLLVHAYDPSVHRSLEVHLRGRAHLRGRTGEWQLFESDQPTLPLCAPDPPIKAGDPTLWFLLSVPDPVREERSLVP